jgi:hypothetical protein
MTREQAITRANEWVAATNGACVVPAAAELSELAGARRWKVWYDTAALMRACGEDLPAGTVVDGPYIVVVDDTTAEVSVLG